MKKFIKKFFKILLLLVLLVVLVIGGLVGLLSATEYKPASIETAEPVKTNASPAMEPLPQNAELKILSWNIGYAGLGAESDFFMDGGKDSRSSQCRSLYEVSSFHVV